MVGDVLSFAFWERILGAMTVFLDFFFGGGEFGMFLMHIRP